LPAHVYSQLGEKGNGEISGGKVEQAARGENTTLGQIVRPGEKALERGRKATNYRGEAYPVKTTPGKDAREARNLQR